MIVDAILTAGVGFLNWIMTVLLPPLPDSFVSEGGVVTNLAVIVGSMSPWVNWPLLVLQVTTVMGLYFTFLTIKIVRALIAHIPFFGGTG